MLWGGLAVYTLVKMLSIRLWESRERGEGVRPLVNKPIALPVHSSESDMEINEDVQYPFGFDASQPNKRPPSRFYDTLTDLPIHNGMHLDDLSNLLWGAVQVQPQVKGTMKTGMLSLHWPSNSPWGIGVRFGCQLWFARSKPYKRIGKPLRPGEVRSMSILICTLDDDDFIHADDGKDPGSAQIFYGTPPAFGSAQITTIQLRFRNNKQTMAELIRSTAKPCNDSYGSPGVPAYPIHLFEHQGEKALDAVDAYAGKHAYHLVFSSHANVYAEELKEKVMKANRMDANASFSPQDIQAGSHIAMITASLCGVSIPDLTCSNAKCASIERYTVMMWCAFVSNYVQLIEKQVQKKIGGNELSRTQLTDRVWKARSEV